MVRRLCTSELGLVSRRTEVIVSDVNLIIEIHLCKFSEGYFLNKFKEFIEFHGPHPPQPALGVAGFNVFNEFNMFNVLNRSKRAAYKLININIHNNKRIKISNL